MSQNLFDDLATLRTRQWVYFIREKPGDRADEQENRARSKVPSAYGEMSAACDVTRTGLRVANA